MMKPARCATIAIVFLLGLMTLMGCLGTTEEEIVRLALTETAGAVEATRLAQPSKTIVLSYHGRFVTAMGAADNWLLRQEPALIDCGKFTLHYLDDGKVALMTCHDRYVTAPKSGVERKDWLLWQEPELGECGRFELSDLSGDQVALKTCAGNFVTAGDAGWDPGLEWSIVAETADLRDWEIFTLLQPLPPRPLVIANFDSCKEEAIWGAAIEPLSGDSLTISYLNEVGRGCSARLEYAIADWSAFWIRLTEADLSPYSQLVFDIKAEPKNIPGQVTLELKQAGLTEVSTLLISELTTDWQEKSVNLEDFDGSLSSLADIEELAFKFDAGNSGSTGVIYLDDISLR
jgi:hypothetical protein